MTLLSLRDHPEWAERAATWFHEKWQVPREVYAESIALAIAGDTPWPAWYLILDGEHIIAGCGIAEDFHDRPDLMPNLVALYVEPAHRCQGIAGRLLAHACADIHARGISTLYLITEHTSFYERYGWQFLTTVHDDEGAPIRMYQKETQPFDRNDATLSPTLAQIDSFLTTPLWYRFRTWLVSTYPVKPVFAFSKCSLAYGWNIKFKKGRKTLCTVYLQDNGFTVMVVVANKQAPLVEEALPTFCEAVRNTYNTTTEGNGQRWLMLNITDPAVLDDIATLLAIRAATM